MLGNQSQSESSTNGARRSLFRGKKGKRLSETVVSSIAAVDYRDTDGGGKRASVLRKGRKPDIQSEHSLQNLRHRISSPFDFQHLTHTDRHQFAALEKIPGDKLAAGLWAVSTSQPPSRGLTGIRVDDLHFNNFSSESLATSENQSMSALNTGMQPSSLEASLEWPQSDRSPPVEASKSTLRLTRSVESFSQPGVSPRNHRHSQSVVAPPRFSSLPPLVPVHDGSDSLDQKDNSIAQRSSRSKRESGMWDSFELGTATTPERLPGIQGGPSYFGHALTTPDDSAILAMTPPFSPSLEDVAEEPDRFTSPRPAPQPPLRTPTTPRSPHFETFPFNSQRSPLTRTRARGNSHTSPKSSIHKSPITRPVSQMSETLGSTCLSRRGSILRPSANRRKSNTWRAIEESWEDDVDYIYENALEADCDFEWDRASDDELHDSHRLHFPQTSRVDPYSRIAQDPQARLLAYDSEKKPQQQFPPVDFRTSLLVPSASTIPQLVSTSAGSFSAVGPQSEITSESIRTNHFNVDEGFALSPSLLVPQEYKDSREVTYEDLLDEYDGSDRHFPLLGANQSTTSSARSSHIRSSRRSSYDSSFISSTQSSGLWSSPIRRSASSAGSVPELVPSRRSRKEPDISLVVDKLSEQVAFLHSFDESKEDDDITPPGRNLEGRTFFASEDEPQGIERPQSLLESELKVSLELAQYGSRHIGQSLINSEALPDLGRQASQRSSRVRHHKQALSDSAAKSPATARNIGDDQPSRLRSRAATTTHAPQPMLSLFPTPPRKTPTPTRI